MRRFVWVTLSVLFVSLALPAETGAEKKRRRQKVEPPAAVSLAVGDPAPRLGGTTPFGARFRLREAVGPDGGAAALVVVFADLGADASSRALNQARKLDVEWGSQNVTVVLVGVGNRPGVVERRALEGAAGWPLLADPDRAFATSYGVSELPTAVVVDGEGVIRAVHTSGDGNIHAVTRETLASLLGVAMPWGESGRRSTLLSFDAKYRFGRPPSDAGAATRWQPLAKYMGEVANVFISMVSARTYEEFEKMIHSGELEIVNAGPATGAKMLERYEPVVRLDRRDRSTYHGIFFARRNHGITAIEDLRGKTVALVSERSTSGGLYPAATLMQRGLRLEDDVRVFWAKTHRQVAEAVRDGRADAGACYDDCRELVWRSEKERDAATVLVGQTSEIPNEMIFFRRDLPQDKKDRLRAALLSISAKELVIRQLARSEEPITGVGRADRSELERVRDELEGVAQAIDEAKHKAAKRQAEGR